MRPATAARLSSLSLFYATSLVFYHAVCELLGESAGFALLAWGSFAAVDRVVARLRRGRWSAWP